jgi:ArsR family transcriptional regulator, arsenate/arsenite/antimonite-responsive transcriptional repressor
MKRASRDRAVRVAKALSDATRFSLLATVAARREICCRDLVGLLAVSQATVSHHLKVLALAGLVEARREGQFSYFRARGIAIDEYTDVLARAFRPHPRRASRREAER